MNQLAVIVPNSDYEKRSTDTESSGKLDVVNPIRDLAISRPWTAIC